ncbi:MAG TPA: hypothetical protein VES62_17835 [Thermoleophilaceae bacterium]|nr:hypothetical protein [Thermoleophilaceae bacterium]
MAGAATWLPDGAAVAGVLDDDPAAGAGATGCEAGGTVTVGAVVPPADWTSEVVLVAV